MDLDFETNKYDEPDEIKKNLYDSLYTYILQKRQEDIINRPDFVI